MTVPQAHNPYDWLNKHIAAEHAYWQRQGLPANLMQEVAELIELYGDELEMLNDANAHLARDLPSLRVADPERDTATG